MGKYLNTHCLRHGERRELARELCVSERTLRNWKARGGTHVRPGRPARAPEVRDRSREWVETRWRCLPRGHDGWRSVCAALDRDHIAVPTRVVQEIVRELKALRRERVKQRIEANRVQVTVLARDALWCADQTHLERDEYGPVKALAVNDCLGPSTLAASVGPPAQGADVVRVLEQAAEVRRAWPFVVQLDNGSENANELVEERLRREQVIVLWNLPRTPQHNPRAERTFGDLKQASGLDALAEGGADPSQGPVWSSEPGVSRTRTSLCVRLVTAWQQLYERTVRPRLAGLTLLELDRIAPHAEDLACRARFYADVCKELERIALSGECARARRMQEREAIFGALECAGLVTRTRGGLPVPTVKAEGVS